MKCVHPKHSGVEVGVGFEKLSKRAGWNVMAARQRKVRVPRSQIGFQSDAERRFLDAFMNLKEVRVPPTDADPDNLNHASWRKCSNAFDWQKKRAKLDRREFFPQSKIDIVRHVREKTEGEMDLIARSPAGSGNSRVKVDQNLAD